MAAAPTSRITAADVAVLEAPYRVVLRREFLDPAALGPGELLCQTEVTVISPGTELAAYSGAPHLRSGVVYPRVLGYCNVAHVIDRGSSVTHIALGDRVLTFGSHRTHFAISSDDVLAVLDPELSSEDAVCAYLFHLGYSAVLDAGVRLGSQVVVIGLGTLGLSAVAMSVLGGARVFAIGDQAQTQEVARAFGAAGSFKRTELGALHAALGEQRADVVITTSSAWSDWPLALECAGVRGTIAVVGFPGRHEQEVPTNPLDSRHFYTRQLRILAVGMLPERPDPRGFLRFNERTNLAAILRWMVDGCLRPRAILSGEYPGREICAAYDALLGRSRSAITFLLRWNV
jgi:threonine dehydrogenase-like Zn-dependent dehydrogenase